MKTTLLMIAFGLFLMFGIATEADIVKAKVEGLPDDRYIEIYDSLFKANGYEPSEYEIYKEI